MLLLLDIDLLVRRAQVPHAVRVLEANGYCAEGPWQRWAAAPYHVEIPLRPRGDERRFPLDLHWGLVGPAGVGIALRALVRHRAPGARVAVEYPGGMGSRGIGVGEHR